MPACRQRIFNQNNIALGIHKGRQAERWLTTDGTFGREALLLHASGRPGKIEIRATKPLTTQRDLSLAYSPGVAVPCLRIAKDPDPSTTTPPRATWWR